MPAFSGTKLRVFYLLVCMWGGRMQGTRGLRTRHKYGLGATALGSQAPRQSVLLAMSMYGFLESSQTLRSSQTPLVLTHHVLLGSGWAKTPETCRGDANSDLIRSAQYFQEWSPHSQTTLPVSLCPSTGSLEHLTG